MAIRNPAVAGQFYSGTTERLLKEVGPLVVANAKRERAIGVISPHAGYLYSGPVAGSVLSSIEPAAAYIILGPNHSGMGKPFSLSGSSGWKTPLGEVSLDGRLAGQIKKNSRYIEEDDAAHLYEHSIEVQLPFLQVLNKKFAFVPIVISHAQPRIYKEIGKELASSVKELGMEREVTIIASSDMTHYESEASAKKKDAIAIEAILSLDEERLVSEISKHEISMCGYAPAVVMISAAKELGARSARLVKYATSAEASGDHSSVVGYAGIIIT